MFNSPWLNGEIDDLCSRTSCRLRGCNGQTCGSSHVPYQTFLIVNSITTSPAEGVTADSMNGFYKYGFRYYASAANSDIDRAKPFLYDQDGVYASSGSPLRHSGAPSLVGESSKSKSTVETGAPVLHTRARARPGTEIDLMQWNTSSLFSMFLFLFTTMKEL